MKSLIPVKRSIVVRLKAMSSESHELDVKYDKGNICVTHS